MSVYVSFIYFGTHLETWFPHTTALLRLDHHIYPYRTEQHDWASKIHTAHQTTANCPDWPTSRGSRGTGVPAWCDLLHCTQQANGPLAANREQKEAAAVNEDYLWEEGEERKSYKEVKADREKERKRSSTGWKRGGWQMEWRGESENERQIVTISGRRDWDRSGEWEEKETMERQKLREGDNWETWETIALRSKNNMLEKVIALLCDDK